MGSVACYFGRLFSGEPTPNPTLSLQYGVTILDLRFERARLFSSPDNQNHLPRRPHRVCNRLRAISEGIQHKKNPAAWPAARLGQIVRVLG